jgi:hypothetical protein
VQWVQRVHESQSVQSVHLTQSVLSTVNMQSRHRVQFST